MTLPHFSERAPLGRTGFLATRVGIGDLADRSRGLDACVRTLTRALDAGLNVVDTAPAYEDGFSEEVVGAALRGRREGVFVIDKIDHHDQPLPEQIGGSLARLGLDRVDLFVFHSVSEPAKWQALARDGGPLDQLAAEIAAGGAARFKGISSHHPDVLMAALASGKCDVVMLPLGPYVDRRYVAEVLPEARRRGVGVVSFKTFGGGKLVADTEGYGKPLASGRAGLPKLGVEECVRYTLGLGPDVMLLGLSNEEEQDAALPAAARAEPLTPDACRDLERRAALAVEGKGRVWWNPSGT